MGRFLGLVRADRRLGDGDSSHTPLLFPGPTFAGVLRPGLRIVEDGGGGFVSERTPANTRRLHPTTLYRMEVIEPEAVPELLVFEDQQQWLHLGDTVEGGYRRVGINDIVAQHGPCSGPIDSAWQTATVVVSRSRLLCPEELSYWNFLSARHEAAVDVPGHTTFNEATHPLARLYTEVTPKSAANLKNDPPLPTSLPIDTREFTSVELDAPIPAVIAIGEPLTISGTVTMTGGYFDRVFASFRHQSHPLFASAYSYLRGDRFSVSRAFSDTQVGDFRLELCLLLGNDNLCSTVEYIRVATADADRSPTAMGSLPDRTLALDGSLEVNGLQAAR